MKEYQEKYKHVVDFAYNAERGIEDEIQRSSMGDVSIIGVSYLLMFLYITVALGNFSADCRQMMVSFLRVCFVFYNLHDKFHKTNKPRSRKTAYVCENFLLFSL